MTVLDAIRAHAETRPEHPALVVGGAAGTRCVSYSELTQRMDAGEMLLRAAGLREGDRCGLLARQGPGFVEQALAILAARGCLVPIPPDHRAASLERFAVEAALNHLVLEEASGFGHCARERVPAVDGANDEAFRALSPAYMRFTSGTTSESKGVIVSHRRVDERLDAANEGLNIGPDDRVLWLLPMAHHFLVSILLYLRFGATILLPEGPLARTALELASRARASVLYASPFHYHLLSKDASEIGLSDVRLVVSTAEGLREDVSTRFGERFGLAISQALGIIEVGLPVINLSEARSKPLALGRALPAYQVRLRREDGSPLEGPGSPERTGEICIRGPGLFDAYLSPWRLSSELIGPGGFRTGDQGWTDAEGTIHLAGRRHNRINMAGMKFFSEEVERVLVRHPAVRECRVFARRHAQLGEIPVAEITLEDPRCEPQRAELVAHCREVLPTYKIPRDFRVVSELARTLTGKVRR